jgi:transposase
MTAARSGAAPPGHSQQVNRRKPFPYNKRAYRHRNKIARMFFKDARRVATRYGKSARNFLSAVCSIAAIYFWFN